MSLSNRDRAKVNAALVLMRDEGYDPAEVTKVAESIINTGAPTRQAYERAFNKFVERVPSFHAPLQRLGQMIETTNDHNLAQYNVALSNYIATGDRDRFEEAVAPFAQQDAIRMARETGDASFADGLQDLPANAPAQNTPAEPVGASHSAARPGWGHTGYSRPKDSSGAPAAPQGATGSELA